MKAFEDFFNTLTILYVWVTLVHFIDIPVQDALFFLSKNQISYLIDNATDHNILPRKKEKCESKCLAIKEKKILCFNQSLVNLHARFIFKLPVLTRM